MFRSESHKEAQEAQEQIYSVELNVLCLLCLFVACSLVRYNAARGEVMYAPKFSHSLVVMLLVTLGGVGLVYSRMTQEIPRGEWGGTHINMNVGEQLAKLEFDCAHGEIPGPLSVDGEGKFKLPGTFTPERGGPVRADDTSRARPAIYSGTIKGNTMTLTMKIEGSEETESFTLEKGKEAELFKCK
jgi:hypothetical protein